MKTKVDSEGAVVSETLEARVKLLEGLIPPLLGSLRQLEGEQARAIQTMRRMAESAEKFREATLALLPERENPVSGVKVH